MPKVNILASTQIFQASTGVTEVNTQVDMYSYWKDWMLTDTENMKYPQAFRVVGGDVIASGREVGDYYFLQTASSAYSSGWRFRPYEAHHECTITGNFYSDSTNPLYVPTSGAYTVPIILERSQLTQTAFQFEVSTINTGSGLSSAQASTITQTNARVGELWTIQGLDTATPVSTAVSSIKAGASIQLDISGDPETKVVTQRS